MAAGGAGSASSGATAQPGHGLGARPLPCRGRAYFAGHATPRQSLARPLRARDGVFAGGSRRLGRRRDGRDGASGWRRAPSQRPAFVAAFGAAVWSVCRWRACRRTISEMRRPEGRLPTRSLPRAASRGIPRMRVGTCVTCEQSPRKRRDAEPRDARPTPSSWAAAYVHGPQQLLKRERRVCRVGPARLFHTAFDAIGSRRIPHPRGFISSETANAPNHVAAGLERNRWPQPLPTGRSAGGTAGDRAFDNTAIQARNHGSSSR
jgi:hypothetical protein